MSLIKDFWQFLMSHKKWWLFPVILMLVLLGILIAIGGSSVIAPFIYTIF